MRILKIIVVFALVYVGVVVVFESFIGFLQPANESTLVITTFEPVSGAEHARVDAEHRLPLVFRILTGFPPRYFVRLDPKPASGFP